MGISIHDLDLLTIGMVNDMFTESRNDDYDGYTEVATQTDYDLFYVIMKAIACYLLQSMMYLSQTKKGVDWNENNQHQIRRFNL